MQVRTHGDRAVITTTCHGGDTHQVRFTREVGVVDTVHDADADAVVAALGGHAHPCQVAINSFAAARACVDAYRGVRDFPEVRVRGQQWTHPGTCAAGCSGNDLQHFTSPPHAAAHFSADPHAVQVLTRWLLRAHDPAQVAARRPRDTTPILALLDGWVGNHSPTQLGQIIYHHMITPTYIHAARALTGADTRALLTLRRGGCTVQWLQQVAAHTSPAAAARALDTNRLLASTLVKARNVPATAVAAYLNAGVTAHFYTYHTSQVSPAQVLQVWHGSDHQRTLAGLLKEGWTVPQALESFPAR